MEISNSLSCKGLEAITETVPCGIFTLDPQQRILFWNRSAERITGYTKQEIVGKSWNQIGLGACVQYAQTLATPAQDYKEIHNMECELIRKDGSKLQVLTNLRILYHSDGEIKGTVGSIADITYLRQIEQSLHLLEKNVLEQYALDNMVGKTPAMQRVYYLVRMAAQSDTDCLVLGETGTGKELAARAIHYNSERRHHPFVAVHCAALTESLLESELFGHIKGAFTGAIRDKIGRFELADHGTIFLDEIGELTPYIQVKLLRVLQERQLERVGESKSRNIDVRIIAATNRDLNEMVAEKRFRADLYYRLKVFAITLPPLRDRHDDIPLLSARFLKENSKSSNKVLGIAPEAMRRLLKYHWPGNVRELKNALEHALVLCQGATIQPDHLPEEIVTPRTHHQPRRERSLSQSDPKQALLAALDASGGNRSEAARILGVSRVTIWNRMKKYGLLP